MKIAYGKIDITPQTPQFVCGHAMRSGKSTGVHDPLELSVLWLDIAEKKICIINADLIMMSFNFCDEVRQTIAERYDTAREYVILSVTHTHSGPNFGDPDAAMKMMAGDPDYIADVKERLYANVSETYSRLQEFDRTVCHSGLINGYYGNRNDIKKDGDKGAYLIEFKKGETTIAALANMSCHSTVNNPTELNLSADLLGNVRRQLHSILGYDIIITNGSAGDMSNRQYRQGNDWSELERISSGIAKQIAEFDTVTELELRPIKAAEFDYHVEYDQDLTQVRAELQQLEDNLERETKFDAKKWLYSEIAGYQNRIANPHVKMRLDGEVLRLGDLELIIIPGELASNFGLQLKRSSTAKICMVIGYANGFSTYIVEASEFNGGHDGISTNLKRGQAEEYIGKIIQKMF